MSISLLFALSPMLVVGIGAMLRTEDGYAKIVS